MPQQIRPESISRPRARLWFRGLAAATVVLAGVGLLAFLIKPASRSTAPKSSVQSSPVADAAYVGTRRCAECHPGEAAYYSRTGHAETFAETRHSEIAARLDGLVFHDPERGISYTYEFDEDGLWVTAPERFGEDRFPLQYALGSGRHAVTFLSLVPSTSADSVGIEHRVSWFAEPGELNLTPGHRGLDATQVVEVFGRIHRNEELSRCVGCHTVTAEVAGDKLVKLRENVGCESCHGPGGAHVAAVARGAQGPAVPFSKGNWTAIEEVAMCGQCHRLPDAELAHTLDPDDHKLTRFQPVGLSQSPCFLKSEGKLSCSTCHNPHQHASRKSAREYERNCLACHTAPHQTACPVSASENCIRCHMPAVEVHPGIEFHDHWIRVRKDQ